MAVPDTTKPRIPCATCILYGPA